MEQHIRAVIDEMVEKTKHKKENGPIEMTADQLWKYSGKTEPSNIELIEFKEEERYYSFFKKTIKDVDLTVFFSSKDGLIIDYFYKNPNHTIEQISQNLNRSVTTVSATLKKYLKLKRDK